MDIRPHRCLRRHRHLASKEPRLFSHGYSNTRLHTGVDTRTFKGAIVLQLWIQARRCQIITIRCFPSKRSRLYSYGYARIIDAGFEIFPNDLQWSHGLSAMDTMILLSAFIVAFSLQRSHGFSAMGTRQRLLLLLQPQLRPSMELRPFSAMDTAAVVWDEDAEPVVTGETEQQRTGNFACKLYPEIERSTSV